MHIFVKPKAGFLIPDLALRDNLPPEGRLVDDGSYWQRRIADGDVTLVPTSDLKKGGK